MMRSPIFIGGLFKSGTTLLRRMIGQHSRIASGMETYWFDLDLSPQARDAQAERLRLLAEFYGFSADEIDRFAADASAETFLDRLLGAYAERLGKTRWAEKTPGNILHVDRILAAWPDARILHIIRDPRDVFASLREAHKWDSVEEFSSRWCDFLGTARAFKDKGLLTDETCLELRYEDLATEPSATMHRVLEFVGESWEDEVGAFSGDNSDFEKLRELTGKQSTTLQRLGQPLSRQRIGIWHDILSPDEIDAVRRVADERDLGALMREIEERTP